jgi:hypothetical protein
MNLIALAFSVLSAKLLDMKKSNKGLFSNKRFEYLKLGREKHLKGLSLKKSVAIMEGIIGLANELRGNFSLDRPVCVKIGLKNRNKK